MSSSSIIVHDLSPHDARPPEPDDLELARRCLAGDPSALRVFSSRFRPVALAAAATVGFVGADADEVVQRLFVRLLVPTPNRPARLHSYQGKGSLLGWIRVCAVREALMVRRAARSRLDAADEEATTAPDPAPHPENAVAQRHAERLLEGAFGRALEGLDARERNLLRYCAFGGANQEQVARVYGVHRATVSRWFDRLRAKLRRRTLRTLADETVAIEPRACHELLPSRLDMRLSQVLDRRLEVEPTSAARRSPQPAGTKLSQALATMPAAS